MLSSQVNHQRRGFIHRKPALAGPMLFLNDFAKSLLMSEDENNHLPCEQKLTFDSLAEAKASAVVIKWQRGTKLKPYKCTHCELWHLTSNDADRSF